MAGTDAASDLHGYNGGELVATCALFLTLTWISVGLRTYTRRFLTHCFQADDWLMLVSLVRMFIVAKTETSFGSPVWQGIFTLSCSFILAGCAVGMGHHNADITNDEDKVAALKVSVDSPDPSSRVIPNMPAPRLSGKPSRPRPMS